MQVSFREFHLFQILSQYTAQPYPLDLFLKNYFKTHRAVGSKDRKSICEALYDLIRWRGLIDYLTTKPLTWEKRYQTYRRIQIPLYLTDATIPSSIRASFPKAFYQLLQTSLGEKEAFAFCLVSNETAPTTIRANALKTTREALLQRWEGKYLAHPCSTSPWGIYFEKRENFFAMPEFKEGLFEVQDEASQLIADLIDPKPTDHVLDFCAGAGGKTLAFAPKMQGRGQIFLHDIRPHALLDAKKRLKRAGVQNAQLLSPDAPQYASLKKTMDWVLVDAPCSGSGTLRRNPDLKWKFDPQGLQELIEKQRLIFGEALSFLQPKGYIVYATCSVLPQENEEQVAFFEKEFSLRLVRPPYQTFPSSGGMDGFFGAVFQRDIC